ncbi:putative methyltransferase C2C4.06c [Protomyces lactucae-debilis]|uniref:Putative methyltransferase C2C4.06c n=1 Tax=Protomyces lactucae-debilis TaxID=2754530 RepID=A0A1Y2EU99_PROLT|nr:putative methyltransferase C2C4.06c [Protomyces lactucae-debilis]ORY75138.1 putative methyltransferase C2C4.06c [Protomyces lactucae-debilis]
MDFYIKAAKVISALDAKQGSIKGLTLQSGDKNGPRTYALVLETLKYRAVLEKIIKDSGMLLKERKLAAQGPLCLVLVHDLLLNKAGIVSNAGLFKDAVLRHKTRLNAEWVKAKIKLKAKDNQALAKRDETFIPRWARVNTLKTSMEAVLDSLSFPVVDSLEALKVGSVYIDVHIENLLAFHPNETLNKHKHYLDGSLIFQNKASCIPAAILNPHPGAHVIDACAAPGNKTSHLAALLQGTGKLFAFERDPRRVQVLQTMLDKAGAPCTVAHQDFTRTDPKDAQYAQVTHLLLDPSCSGSGIVNRLDYLTEQDAQPEDTVVDERLESLAAFQKALLLHAMHFPAAQKITYSTCSVHAIENEGVVIAALKARPDWQVADRSEALPSWSRRGVLAECDNNKQISEGLVRAMPGEHGTIGFFIATFEKPASKKVKKSEAAADEIDDIFG